MSEVGFRALVLVGAVLVAWAYLVWSERRTKSVLGLESGITIVTTATCAICPEAVSTLRSLAVSAPVRVLDAADPRADIIRASAAPTVVVADGGGREVLRRTGRATITDAAHIVAVAQPEELGSNQS